MQYTEKELAKLIEDVEKEFTAHLSKSEESFKLAKSEDGEAKPKDKKKDEKSKDEGQEEEKPAAEAKPEGEAEAHGDEGHDYDDEDMEHMHKMYRSMSKGELKAHHDAIMKCIEPGDAPHGAEGPVSGASKEQDEIAKGGLSPEQIKAKLKKADGCGGEISSNEPKGSPGAKSPASKDQKNLDDLEKVETGKIEANAPKGSPGSQSPASKDQKNLSNMEKSMEKTEVTEVQLLKSENESLKKNFEAVTEFLTKLVKKTAPAGKAITSLDVVAKSEGNREEQSLTKSEINAILLRKSSDPSLQKSDREAINSYYLSGQANINSISHLLK
jgi:hypothetical protein